MSQNQEIIESRLCAYIDGELEPEGRTEIEKHLESNPQHRRLLESLKATRDLVRWLPREAAPPELAETLNGQLERSVLLDDSTESTGPSVWPRVFAAAAIVVLTAGLGLAVYFTLPKSQKSAMPYALRGDSAIQPPTSDVPAEVDRGGDLAASAREQPTAAAQQPMNPPPETEARTPELDQLVAVAGAERNTLLSTAATRPSQIDALVFVVRTDNPAQARQRLTAFLDDRRIRWLPAPERSEADQTEPTTQLSDAVQPTAESARVLAATVRPATTMSAAPSTQPTELLSEEPTGAVYVARMPRPEAALLGLAMASARGTRALETRDLTESSLGRLEAGPRELAAKSVNESLSPTTAPTGGSELSMELRRSSAEPDRSPSTRESIRFSAAAPMNRSESESDSDHPATTQPSDAPVNVVVVVQSIASSPAPATPTTEPATRPAPTAE